MKTLRLLGVTILFALLASPGFAKDARILKLQNMQGKSIHLKLRPETTYVVQVWASWCLNCSKALAKVNDALSAQKLPNTKLITVSLDETPGAASGYLKKNADLFRRYKLPVLLDPNGEQLQNFALDGVPATLVFRPNGKVDQLNGIPTDDALSQLLKAH